MGGGQAHGVVEGEEAIAGEHGAAGPLPGCRQGDLGRSHPVHLAGADAQALASGGHGDGVGAHVPHHPPGEAQVGPFGFTGLALAHHLPAGRIDRLVVQVLGQHPAEHAAQLLAIGRGDGGGGQLQQPQVRFGGQPLPGGGLEGGGHHALQEQPRQVFGGGGVHGPVDGHDAPEGRDPVGIESPQQGFGPTGAGGHPTGIGVLHHHRRRQVDGRIGRPAGRDPSSGRLAVAELPHRGQGRVEIEQVVVAELLALQLEGCPQPGFGAAVPEGLLVGILAVAQALASRQCELQRWGGRGRVASRAFCLGRFVRPQPIGQPGGDGGVVGGGVGEGGQGQPAPQRFIRTTGDQGLEEAAVLGRIGEHGHIGMVLGRGAHHRRAADVDVLHSGLPAHLGVDHGALEGVEVHHHHIDRIDRLGGQVGLVGGIGSLRQDAAVDAGVESLDPAPEDFGGAGMFRHLGDRQPGRRQGRRGAAAREDPVAVGQQALGQGHQALLIGHTQEGRGGHGGGGGGGTANLRSGSASARLPATLRFSSRTLPAGMFCGLIASTTCTQLPGDWRADDNQDVKPRLIWLY